MTPYDILPFIHSIYEYMIGYRPYTNTNPYLSLKNDLKLEVYVPRTLFVLNINEIDPQAETPGPDPWTGTPGSNQDISRS